MRRMVKASVSLLILIAVLWAIWTYHTDELYGESFSSEFQYEITLKTDSKLKNVSLLLPFPENIPEIEEKLLNDGSAENIDLRIVEGKHGKMLELTADNITPVYHSAPIPIKPEETSAITSQTSEVYSNETPILTPIRIVFVAESDEEIETKNPPPEILLNPKYNLTETDCKFPVRSGRCYSYESLIYADYEGYGNISIYIRLEGRNSWWIYGWSGNEFRDTIIATILGEKRRWIRVEGKLITGEGVYKP